MAIGYGNGAYGNTPYGDPLLRSVFAQQSLTASVQFIFKDVDESLYLKNAATVTRTADKVTVGNVSVRVDNSNGHWDGIRTDKGNNFLKTGILKLKVNDYFYDYFTGKLEKAFFDKKEVLLTFRDSVAYFLKRRVGSSVIPKKYIYPEITKWKLYLKGSRY